MKVITNEDKKLINKLYLEMGTYAAVARATGFSPGTVKKYVIPNYSLPDENNIIRYSREGLPDFDSTQFRNTDWGELCTLSVDELKEIYELWKEIDL
jgi:hypothetical protein